MNKSQGDHQFDKCRQVEPKLLASSADILMFDFAHGIAAFKTSC